MAPSRCCLELEEDLKFDLHFARHLPALRTLLRKFRPEVVHVTGPNHAGLLGVLLACELRLPLVASWHTNLHEYVARRLRTFAPGSLARWAQSASFKLLTLYYRIARVILAPHQGLIRLLERETGKPCRLMRRGVDCKLFDPRRRARRDTSLVIGYVGRLSPEKSVRRLADLERALCQAGLRDFRIEIVGHGGERSWLHANIRRLRDHGLRRGEELAQIYAGFDVFAFPSETDTYGNVVLEAMASGVPCVVTAEGGPAHIVTHGLNGFVARDFEEFARAVTALALDAGLRASLAREARRSALLTTWDSVFEQVYDAYAEAAQDSEFRRPMAHPAA